MPRKLQPFILVLASIAVCIGGGSVSMGAEGTKVPRGYTLKIVGETEYLMPSAYIWNPRRRGSGVDKGFSIHAYFPDLAPLGPANKHIAEMKGGNQYMYSIHVQNDDVNTIIGFNNLGCSANGSGGKYGLVPIVCTRNSSTSDSFAVFSAGKVVSFVSCSKQYAPSPACDLQFDHGGNVVSAFFPQRMLSDAPRVHRDIVGLLDEFVRTADALRHQAR